MPEAKKNLFLKSRSFGFIEVREKIGKKIKSKLLVFITGQWKLLQTPINYHDDGDV